MPPAAFTQVAVLLLASFLATVVGVRELARPSERQGAEGWRVYPASLLACRAALRFFVGLFALFFFILLALTSAIALVVILSVPLPAGASSDTSTTAEPRR